MTEGEERLNLGGKTLLVGQELEGMPLIHGIQRSLIVKFQRKHRESLTLMSQRNLEKKIG